MSFRAAARISARFAAPRATTQVVARRAASSAAPPHKPGSDLPWIAGSTVVFGSLAAFLLYPSKQDVHHHTAPHSEEKEDINESAPTAQPGKDTVINTGSAERADANDAPENVNAKATKDAEDIPTKREGKTDVNTDSGTADEKSGGKNADDVAQEKIKEGEDKEEKKEEPKEEKKEEPKEEKKDEEPKDKEEGEPSAKDVKDSVAQAAKSDSPETAKAAEESGENKKE
ncbi:hypothetical protein IAT38_008123 [Cryptococcus sp. DSM 104549]